VVTVWGWGRGEEGWHLGHWEIDGDPQQKETLEQLERIAATKWRREDGAEVPLAMGAIDEAGHSTQEVRDWCRKQGGLWVPVRGDGAKGKPLVGRGTPVDINRKNQAVQKKGLLLYRVCYETSVSHLQGRLRNEIPGPGYLHLGEASTDQFLAELFPWKRMPKKGSRGREYHWDCPTGMRDEAGDCTRYAYAALQLVSRRYNRATMWDQLAAQLAASVALDQQAAPRKARSFTVLK